MSSIPPSIVTVHHYDDIVTITIDNRIGNRGKIFLGLNAVEAIRLYYALRDALGDRP